MAPDCQKTAQTAHYRASALSFYATPLNGHYDVTKVLLEAGADANLSDGDVTLIGLLREYQADQKMVDLLLDYGAKE